MPRAIRAATWTPRAALASLRLIRDELLPALRRINTEEAR
jgi:hypothetical protein